MARKAAKGKKEKVRLERGEGKQIEQRTQLRSPVIFEIIRRDGEEELERPNLSLAMSGIAAGFGIGFSVLAQAALSSKLPDVASSHLIASIGYSVGFLIVILARLQLFTENTITVVLPVLLNPSTALLVRVAQLWGIVLTANVAGCFVFAGIVLLPGAVPPELLEAMFEISRHMMGYSRWEMFIKGIFSGWLIACLVWILPTARGTSFFAIMLLTSLIAAGEFTHIVAGSVEAFLVVLTGEASLLSAVGVFFIPTLLGNIVGGTVFFSLLNYGQVSQEV